MFVSLLKCDSFVDTMPETSPATLRLLSRDYVVMPRDRSKQHSYLTSLIAGLTVPSSGPRERRDLWR